MVDCSRETEILDANKRAKKKKTITARYLTGCMIIFLVILILAIIFVKDITSKLNLNLSLFIWVLVVQVSLLVIYYTLIVRPEGKAYKKYMQLSQTYISEFFSSFVELSTKLYPINNKRIIPEGYSDLYKAEQIRVKLRDDDWFVILEYRYSEVNNGEKETIRRDIEVHTEAFLQLLGIIQEPVGFPVRINRN
jgi:hypothetical protein